MISLTLLTIILILIRIYYFKLSETVNLNNGSHEIFINIFGTSTIIRGLFHTKPIQTLYEVLFSYSDYIYCI